MTPPRQSKHPQLKLYRYFRNGASVLLLFALSACSSDRPVVYDVPKNDGPRQNPAMDEFRSSPSIENVAGTETIAMETYGESPPPLTPQPGTAGPWNFTLPPGWTILPASGMRTLSISIATGDQRPAADFSVIALPGPAGGLVANINRWRGQIGLPAQSPTEIQSALLPMQTEAGLFQIIDMNNPAGILEGQFPARTTAAIHSREDTSWFFKLTGESNHVAEQRGTFFAFLHSLSHNE